LNNLGDVAARFHEIIHNIHNECIKQLQLESEVFDEECLRITETHYEDPAEVERLKKIADAERLLAELKGEKLPATPPSILKSARVTTHIINATPTHVSDEGQSENKKAESDEFESVEQQFKRLDAKNGNVWKSKESVLKWKKTWISIHNSLKGYKKANGRLSTEAKLLAQKKYKTEFLGHKKMTKDYLKFLVRTKTTDLKGTFNPTEHEKAAFNALNMRELESYTSDYSADSAKSDLANDANKCISNTTAGNRCSNNALQGKDYCRQHYDQVRKRRRT